MNPLMRSCLSTPCSKCGAGVGEYCVSPRESRNGLPVCPERYKARPISRVRTSLKGLNYFGVRTGPAPCEPCTCTCANAKRNRPKEAA